MSKIQTHVSALDRVTARRGADLLLEVLRSERVR